MPGFGKQIHTAQLPVSSSLRYSLTMRSLFSLRVSKVRGCGDDRDGSSMTGGIVYNCCSRNFFLDDCFEEGPSPGKPQV